MKFSKHIYFAATAILLLNITSCKSNKKIANTTNTSSTPIKTNKLEDFYKHQLDYHSFNGKMNLAFDDGKMDQKASANIKMNKGKDVWLMASALGGMIEVARGYATPDSLLGMVGLTKTAYKMSFADGIKKLGVDVGFESLQNLFIGNPLISNAKIQKSREENGKVILQFLQDGYELEIFYNKANGNMEKQLLSNKANNFNCEIIYENYQGLADKQPFSYNRTITIHDNGKKILTKIDFSKAEINTPAIINFRIPDNYKTGKL